MAEISYADSSRETDALLNAIDAAPDDDDATLAALEAALAHPCAPHQMQVTELWIEIAELHRRARRYDDAIAAHEAAMAAGLQSVPHPRADIAELLLEAGRRAEADALYADLRELTGDDVWLYNSAGDAYAMAGDHAEALRWIDAGIELALATGDPEEILFQLVEMRELRLERLGRSPDDDLAARVAAFTPGPPSGGHRYFGTKVPFPEACGHCGWTRADDPLHRSVSSVAASQARSTASGRDRPSSASAVDAQVLGGRSASPAPARSESVGRNDPCPCGSGQKYKRCHGR